MAKTFHAQVSEHVANYERRMLATFRGSTQDLAEEVTRPVAKGGRMRVKTGFMRASLMASTSAMPYIDAGARPPSTAGDNSFDLNDSEIILTIAGAQLGQTIFLGFTASYAGYREALDAFVATAAQRWPDIVRVNAAKAMARYR